MPFGYGNEARSIGLVEGRAAPSPLQLKHLGQIATAHSASTVNKPNITPDTPYFNMLHTLTKDVPQDPQTLQAVVNPPQTR